MARPIDALARRVLDDPAFLGQALAAYARAERLDDGELAARLGCDRDALAPLRLCLRPRAESFAADVDAIAARFGADPAAVAAAVRLADALAVLRQPGVGERGHLMAARDREPPEDR